MNYAKIHDAIINRARSRIYDKKIHHNHHIIPVHEDPMSTETVPLTFREHVIVHMLRYKMGCGIGNKVASLWMAGQTEEAYRLRCSEAGKKGMASLIKNRSGIHSPDWDRSAETKRRWDEGIITADHNRTSEAREASRLRMNKLIEEKRGIHSPDWDRAQASREAWQNRDPVLRVQQARDALVKASKRSVELHANFSGWDPERHREIASMGGKAAGKIPMWTNDHENKRSHESPGEGWRRGFRYRKNLLKGDLI